MKTTLWKMKQNNSNKIERKKEKIKETKASKVKKEKRMNDYNWRINNEKENTEERLDIVKKEKVKSKKEIKSIKRKKRKKKWMKLELTLSYWIQRIKFLYLLFPNQQRPTGRPFKGSSIA